MPIQYKRNLLIIKQLVVICAGGLSQEVLWAASNINERCRKYTFLGFVDDAPERQHGQFCGLPLLGTVENAASAIGTQVWFVCAVGDNATRAKLVERAEKVGWRPETIIDPSVMVAPTAVVGAGSYVAAMCVVSPACQIGRHVIVNHGSSIGHDSKVEDFAQICPGGRVSGYCSLGEGAFVGSNGVVAPAVRIGSWSRVGAGSFAMRNVPENATVVGVPARVVFSSRIV